MYFCFPRVCRATASATFSCAHSVWTSRRPGSWVRSSWGCISRFSIEETTGLAWLPQCKFWPLQESIRPTPNTYSCEGTLGGARDAGELCLLPCKALFSVEIKDFISMVLIWIGASLWVREVHHIWEGSRIKSEAQVREAQLQLAWRKRETYWKDTGDLDTRTRAEPKISVTALISLMRNQKPLSHSLSPLLLPFMHLWLLKPESLLPSGFYI